MQSSAEMVPTFLVRSTQMRLVVSSSSYSSILGRKKVEEVLHVFFEAGVGFILQAADAESVSGEASAAIFLVDLENLFAVAEGVEQRRDGADIERMRAQPELVAGDAVQFSENHANILRAGRRFYVEKFFYGLAIAQAHSRPRQRNPCDRRRD